MPTPARNYWWLNANPSVWSFDNLEPGKEEDYRNKNEDGTPKREQKCFTAVQTGDLVLGYKTAPEKELSCLCEITKPNDGERFFFRKLFDFPNPIPSAEFQALPELKNFHYQGSLFKLTNDQWSTLSALIRERNPGITMPTTASLMDKLDAFLSGLKTTLNPTRLAEAKTSQADFLQRFPLSSFTNLSPNEYCIGKSDNASLCWWAERGTKSVCSFFPGSSQNYGMYFARKVGTLRISKPLQDYRNANPGISDAELLRKRILVPLYAWIQEKGNCDFRAPVRIGFGLKLLLLYHPDTFIHITSTRWMEEILKALGMPVSNNPVENNLAIKKLYDAKKKQFPANDFHQQDFVWFFEKELHLKDKDPTPNEEEIQPSKSSPNEQIVMHKSLNTILYGPPGTGKTYNATAYAVAIVEGKNAGDVQEEMRNDYGAVRKRFEDYKKQGLIELTTFHQSYGYEDFIEGIRPSLRDDDGVSPEMEYELHDGVFKSFCKNTSKPAAETVAELGLNDNPVVWKVSLEGTGKNETRSDCLKNGYIRIGWDDYGESISPETFKDSSDGRTILNAFVSGMSVGDIVLSCWSATEIDAIGVVTGEYEWKRKFTHFRRMRKVRWLVTGIRENILELNGGKKLTLSTIYRLGRIQVSDVLSILSKNHVKSFSPVGDASPKPRVFVIDEINRGNISKIFGELITLVESSKRLGAVEETKAKLPYSGDDFGVPSNVYILGTMNTADRSIALLDTALRRRFEFVEMMPNPELLADINVGDTGINLEMMLRAMNDRIEFLLDREHTIGHAYFLGDFKDHPTLAGLAEIFRNKIVPLLQEYFFDDYSKIRLVLGDNGKKETAVQFFNEKKTNGVFFGNAEDAVDPDRCVYRINEAAFGNPAAYIGIYDDGKTT